ncbi:MAG: S1C family serine protease [Anaerolineae bacterium]
MSHKHNIVVQRSTCEVVEGVAGHGVSTSEVGDGLANLRAVLRENPESATAFSQLMQIAGRAGYQEGHTAQVRTYRTVLLTAVVGILVASMAFGSFYFQQSPSDEVVISRIYKSMSPAVAVIQVESAGVMGSGVVFDDKDGYLVTNYHVIKKAQNDQDIVVQLPGLGRVPSKLVGYDIATDLAVLQVDVPSEGLTMVSFGNPNQVQAGDLAIAIGNPFGLFHSVTVGHISAVGRQLMSDDLYAPGVEGVLQTDASINPGNSGGPLFNARGRVIGINTRIESPSGGSVGIGFAIPSDTALQVAREIIAKGYVSRPFLGVGGRPVDASLAQDLGLSLDRGLLVQEIRPRSPAANAGLNAGDGRIPVAYGDMPRGADVILSIDGQSVRSQLDVNRLVARHAIGDRVKLDILRNGRRLMVDITLTERPLDEGWSQVVRVPAEGRRQEVAGNW